MEILILVAIVVVGFVGFTALGNRASERSAEAKRRNQD